MNQNSTGSNRITPEELQNKYGIKREAYYARLKFLGIKAKKDSNKKAYLNDDQVALMDELDSYIKKEGKMEGFKSSNSSALVKSESSSIEQSAEEINVNGSAQNNQEQLAALVRSASEYAAGMTIAKYTLAAQMQHNPELLETLDAVRIKLW